jgi:hypothetical protein
MRYFALSPIVAVCLMIVLRLVLVGPLVRNLDCAPVGQPEAGAAAEAECAAVPLGVKEVLLLSEAAQGTLTCPPPPTPTPAGDATPTPAPTTTASGTTEEVEKQSDPVAVCQEYTALRSGGRLNWAIWIEVSIAVACFVLVFSALLFFRQKVVFIFEGLLLFVALVAMIISGAMLYTNPNLHMLVVRSIMEFTVHGQGSTIVERYNFASSLSYAVGWFVVLTVCLITWKALAQEHLNNPAKHEQNLAQLSAQMTDLRLLLYASALLLVTGIILLNSIYQWSLAYIIREDAIVKVAETYVATLAAYSGVFYSMLLAAVFVPAMVIVNYQAASVAVPEDVEVDFAKYGLGFSFTESLPRIIAILAPLLAEPAVTLLQALST